MMGSRPWINELRDRLSPDHEGETFVVDCPDGKRVEGMFTGTGSQGSRKFMIINTAPADMGVRDEGYFDHEQWIRFDKRMKINGIPADEFLRPTVRGTS
jgi:hypothetical protein